MEVLKPSIYKVSKRFEVWSVRLYGNGRKIREGREREGQRNREYGCVGLCGLGLVTNQTKEKKKLKSLLVSKA